jgi:hypothetical protein
LMRAQWSRQEFLAIECGQLVFSVAESQRIQRATIARRQASSAANAEVFSSDSRTPRNLEKDLNPPGVNSLFGLLQSGVSERKA